MVIIAINNIPLDMGRKALVKNLTSIIKGAFEVFKFTLNKKDSKTAYIRLAEKLSTKDVIRRINSKKFGSYEVKAFIPDNVADLPLTPIPQTTQTELQLSPIEQTIRTELLNKSLDNIMAEMQTKFTGLHSLSESTQHQLLETIGRIVYKRLEQIVDNKSYKNVTSFHLTKGYRKKHPHHTDFQFIMQHFHSAQSAQGQALTYPQEKQMMTIPLKDRVFSNLSYDTFDRLCQSHVIRISQMLVHHVKSLEVKEETSTPEEAATMKVRKHLKDLAQELPVMVRQSIVKHLIPKDAKFCSVKIYGEPYLPNKEAYLPFIQQYKPVTITRSEHMYNLLSLRVPRELYLKLLQADGAVLKGNAKLVIRPGKLPFYKVRQYLTKPPVVPQSAEGQATTEDQAEEEDMECSET